MQGYTRNESRDLAAGDFRQKKENASATERPSKLAGIHCAVSISIRQFSRSLVVENSSYARLGINEEKQLRWN
jgi:hypothetical protein